MDEVSIPGDHGLVLRKTSRAGGPVTCVSLPSPNCKVWARGPYLQKTQARGTEQLLVFSQGGTIHGIHYSRNVNDSWDAIAFGGRQLAFCNILQEQSSMERLDVLHDDACSKPNMTVSDWIWDVECVVDEDSQTTNLVVGMARHMIEVWQVTSEPLAAKYKRRIYGTPSCLVTSMHLMHLQDKLWIAAGTSFQEIQVWSLNKDLDAASTTSHCLQGHAGIVHSVQFSSDGQSIASTSDDRSVRKWKYDATKQQWASQWVGWGHSARVWSVVFGPNHVVSTAEDCTTRVWSLASGKALACIHHSCSLWTVETLGDLAIVGATDGTVAVYNLLSRVEGKRLKVQEHVPVPDDRPKPVIAPMDNQVTKKGTASEDSTSEDSSVPKTTQKKKTAKKKVSQILVGLKWSKRQDGSAILLVATREGSLMCLNADTQEWQQLEPWWEPSLQKSHQMVSADGCCMTVRGDWATIGTKRGDVVIVSLFALRRRRIILSAQDLKSIQGLTWLNSTTLVSLHVRSVACWVFPNEQLTEVEKPTFLLKMETKGVPICCAYVEDGHRVLVGDSRGNINLFCLGSENTNTSPSEIHSISVLERAHQKLHVTAIVVKKNRVLSVGNDGCLHISFLTRNILQKGWSMPASTMSAISQIWCTQDDSRIYVAGYYGNIFRLVEVFSGHEFFRVDTGGRQRIQDFRADFTSMGSTGPGYCELVVCMNQKDGTNSFLIHQMNQNQKQIVAPPIKFQDGVKMHGETIFSACFFSIGKMKRSVFLLTGSEDCTSKISLYQHPRWVDSISLTPQESCVRTVCSSQVDESSALVVVGGGKLALQFFLVRPPSTETPVNSTHDMEIHFIGKGSTRATATIDHRINAVKALPLDESERLHLVLAGDSDGNCHLFIVNEDSRSQPPPGLFIPTSSRPILCVDLQRIGSRVLALIGTTGGDVLIFDLPGSVEELQTERDALEAQWAPLTKYEAHQMGTNTICRSMKPIRRDIASLTICTGGDDQAVCICEVEIAITNCGKLEMISQSIPQVTREASFSAIKGVFHFTRQGRRFFATAGYSQHVALWEHSAEMGLKLVDRIPVDLGDVNCLTADASSDSDLILAVGGYGVETFALGKSS